MYSVLLTWEAWLLLLVVWFNLYMAFICLGKRAYFRATLYLMLCYCSACSLLVYAIFIVGFELMGGDACVG